MMLLDLIKKISPEVCVLVPTFLAFIGRVIYLQLKTKRPVYKDWNVFLFESWLFAGVIGAGIALALSIYAIAVKLPQYKWLLVWVLMPIIAFLVANVIWQKIKDE